ncbi:N-acetyltransferase [Streptomyces atratus]|uniref:Acetyltransferase (GNAT) domain-containing protein n=1 Tax=Streptomyces atratus TaxID=1893 RepID=A0A1K2F7N4_STRAR|nr:N-acetyltransferase [Streptomyces atratus]SFY43538.1 hypothetical protein SAMN02787144_103726 [Streptomyces atratus]
MEPITLTNDRLLPRPFTGGDTDAIHAACQDPAIQRWTVAPSPYSRAEVGNIPSRAVAPRTGFRMEGEQWSGLLNKGVRRDSWIGALLPSDLGLPGTHACLPAP